MNIFLLWCEKLLNFRYFFIILIICADVTRVINEPSHCYVQKQINFQFAAARNSSLNAVMSPRLQILRFPVGGVTPGSNFAKISRIK